MRPKIADSLENKLEREDGTGAKFFQAAGYTSKSAFVAQAVKEKIQREEEEMDW